ncbi:AAA domain-containing protein [Aureispira anguillae]|uniref:AAA domain-containing protein n=1 Tax=Aureispira anguillae TaxID=2864201 RepID=A0A915YLS8_9BACT|nr:AAA domain-containing protein [Aureispira anguillae]BDS15262.1 AAA domain-containing protein [Aureispira anguillae]
MFDLRFLNNLKQKLTTGNRGSIYLNAQPGRYLSRLDLSDLNWLNPHFANTFFDVLTSNAAFRFPLTPDGRSLNDKDKIQLENVLRRLTVISIENNDHFSEQGVKTFGFGFPILLYKDKKDPNRVLKAPMFIWYLDIERNFKRANEWVLIRQDDFPVINNVVLAAYLRNHSEVQLQPIYDQLLEDAILDKDELTMLVMAQLQQLSPSISESLTQEFRASLDQPIAPLKQAQQVNALSLEEPQVLWSGVFGLFKSQKESIINDLDYFIDHIEQLQQQIAQQDSQKELMKHCFTAVDMDPSQQHLLHLLGQQNNLVIQGPPGTGKSQTLTGIIANVLSNQGNCLVVCEKKTALEVVQQNLVAIGLGELTVIIEDVYRDRQAVVNSVRERAQKQYPTYKTYPSYLRLLESAVAQVEQLQSFHAGQLDLLLEDKTWAELVDHFLKANEHYNKQLLEQELSLEGFEFTADELEQIIPIFEQAKKLLAPLGSLEQPLNQVHDQFFEITPVTQSKLEIQRSITTALRSTRKAQEIIHTTKTTYQEQLEQHYKQLYLKKLHLTDVLYLQSKTLLEKHVSLQNERCLAAQKAISQTIKAYNLALVQHFEELYTKKIEGIDQTAFLIKLDIYTTINEVLDTIKEAKEDIMAALYAYEKLLEEHFEAVYMQKMDLVDAMISTVETGLATSPFYFNKNKGIFRAILRGVGAKYKQLEQDKASVLKQFAQLQKLHKQHKYFKFTFMSTKDRPSFTFEMLLEQLESYRTATDHWHMEQHSIIQEEVRTLSSRSCLKAVPYKEEAQTINQHLSNFRTKILRSKLIPIEFKYTNLRLRDRFDQLEEIEVKVQKIKAGIDDFVQKNEENWQPSNYTPTDTSASYRVTFDALQAVHQQEQYFEYNFIKLGRPTVIQDYYSILEHLTDYRAQVEKWYPSCQPIIERYRADFKLKNLYPPLNFAPQAQQLVSTLDVFIKEYNSTQLLDLPFQLEATLFQEQLEEVKGLGASIENWSLNLEHFLVETNKNWIAHPIKEPLTTAIIEEKALQESYEQLIELHRQYDYFDVTFEVYNYSKELLHQKFIQHLVHYRNWTQQWYNNRAIVFANAVENLSTDCISPHVSLVHQIPTIEKELQQFQASFNQFKHFRSQFEFKNKQLTAQQQQLDALEKQIIVLQGQFENFESYYNFRLFWIKLSPAQQAAYKGLAKAQPKDWAAAFTSWYLHAFLLKNEHKIPDELSYTQCKDLLLSYTADLKKMLISHSLRYWRSKQSQEIERFHQEKAPIKLHSLYNKRGHVGGRRTPLRKIIATSPSLFTSFFPVLLVSPAVCSAILPLQPNLFDVVIFDEASQLRLEDTFCALMRGRYKVVSGDSQQMPPSDYFQSNTVLIHEQEEEEQQAALVNESIDFLTSTESLLEYALAEGAYKESFLEVHYRSKHPYLIDFSNAAFYGNRLTPMPHKEAYTPIQFFAVNGAYTNYTNLAEAEQIIDYIIKVAQPHRGKSCPSVGIATFNIHQRNLILELIQQRAVEQSKAGAQLQKLFMNGLFVKNLENIQGDERDILIISTTFGLREDGSFIQNFGPINRQKGYRLLNVIVTRAKQTLAVFTSIPAKYYENYRTEIMEKGNVGKAVFYAYLAYAKAVSQKEEATRKAILQLLYDHCLKKPVDDFLYQAHDNVFKERVIHFLEQQFPSRVLVNYPYAGFEIPLVVTDALGQPKWAIDFDTFHQHYSEEAYAWDLFREEHLSNFGFIYHRIWSKDWWQDENKAKEQLIQYFQ